MAAIKRIPWIFRILGFQIVYRTNCFTDPIKRDDGYYAYQIEIIQKELKWLNFRIWKKILKH